MEATCSDVSSKVGEIRSDLQKTIRQLDWDVRYQNDINHTANQLASQLDGYSAALQKYRQFLEEAGRKYQELDAYKKGDFEKLSAEAKEPSFWERFASKYGPKNFFKNFGNLGKFFGAIDSIISPGSWEEAAKGGISILQVLANVAKDCKNYMKIGPAIGTKNAVSNFLKKLVGFRKVGHASQAKSASAQFYNNLHNTTSPYNLKDAFKPLTGGKGTFAAVAAWAGIALTGLMNWHSNVDEQKKSEGKMSTGRVAAETISETAIDTIITFAGSALIGAAITTVTGAVAAPAVVAIATGLGLAAINTGVEMFTGQTATEWVSDAILDGASYVGSAIADGAKAVANWFGSLSFA